MSKDNSDQINAREQTHSSHVLFTQQAFSQKAVATPSIRGPPPPKNPGLQIRPPTTPHSGRTRSSRTSVLGPAAPPAPRVERQSFAEIAMETRDFGSIFLPMEASSQSIAAGNRVTYPPGTDANEVHRRRALERAQLESRASQLVSSQYPSATKITLKAAPSSGAATIAGTTQAASTGTSKAPETASDPIELEDSLLDDLMNSLSPSVLQMTDVDALDRLNAKSTISPVRVREEDYMIVAESLMKDPILPVSRSKSPSNLNRIQDSIHRPGESTPDGLSDTESFEARGLQPPPFSNANLYGINRRSRTPLSPSRQKGEKAAKSLGSVRSAPEGKVLLDSNTYANAIRADPGAHSASITGKPIASHIKQETVAHQSSRSPSPSSAIPSTTLAPHEPPQKRQRPQLSVPLSAAATAASITSVDLTVSDDSPTESPSESPPLPPSEQPLAPVAVPGANAASITAPVTSPPPLNPITSPVSPHFLLPSPSPEQLQPPQQKQQQQKQSVAAPSTAITPTAATAIPSPVGSSAAATTAATGNLISTLLRLFTGERTTSGVPLRPISSPPPSLFSPLSPTKTPSLAPSSASSITQLMQLPQGSHPTHSAFLPWIASPSPSPSAPPVPLLGSSSPQAQPQQPLQQASSAPALDEIRARLFGSRFLPKAVAHKLFRDILQSLNLQGGSANSGTSLSSSADSIPPIDLSTRSLSYLLDLYSEGALSAMNPSSATPSRISTINGAHQPQGDIMQGSMQRSLRIDINALLLDLEPLVRSLLEHIPFHTSKDAAAAASTSSPSIFANVFPSSLYRHATATPNVHPSIITENDPCVPLSTPPREAERDPRREFHSILHLASHHRELFSPAHSKPLDVQPENSKLQHQGDIQENARQDAAACDDLIRTFESLFRKNCCMEYLPPVLRHPSYHTAMQNCNYSTDARAAPEPTNSDAPSNANSTSVPTSASVPSSSFASPPPMRLLRRRHSDAHTFASPAGDLRTKIFQSPGISPGFSSGLFPGVSSGVSPGSIRSTSTPMSSTTTNAMFPPGAATAQTPSGYYPRVSHTLTERFQELCMSQDLRSFASYTLEFLRSLFSTEGQSTTSYALFPYTVYAVLVQILSKILQFLWKYRQDYQSWLVSNSRIGDDAVKTGQEPRLYTCTTLLLLELDIAHSLTQYAIHSLPQFSLCLTLFLTVLDTFALRTPPPVLSPLLLHATRQPSTSATTPVTGSPLGSFLSPLRRGHMPFHRNSITSAGTRALTPAMASHTTPGIAPAAALDVRSPLFYSPGLHTSSRNASPVRALQNSSGIATPTHPMQALSNSGTGINATLNIAASTAQPPASEFQILNVFRHVLPVLQAYSEVFGVAIDSMNRYDVRSPNNCTSEVLNSLALSMDKDSNSSSRSLMDSLSDAANNTSYSSAWFRYFLMGIIQAHVESVRIFVQQTASRLKSTAQSHNNSALVLDPIVLLNHLIQPVHEWNSTESDGVSPIVVDTASANHTANTSTANAGSTDPTNATTENATTTSAGQTPRSSTPSVRSFLLPLLHATAKGAPDVDPSFRSALHYTKSVCVIAHLLSLLRNLFAQSSSLHTLFPDPESSDGSFPNVSGNLPHPSCMQFSLVVAMLLNTLASVGFPPLLFSQPDDVIVSSSRRYELNATAAEEYTMLFNVQETELHGGRTDTTASFLANYMGIARNPLETSAIQQDFFQLTRSFALMRDSLPTLSAIVKQTHLNQIQTMSLSVFESYLFLLSKTHRTAAASTGNMGRLLTANNSSKTHKDLRLSPDQGAQQHPFSFLLLLFGMLPSHVVGYLSQSAASTTPLIHSTAPLHLGPFAYLCAMPLFLMKAQGPLQRKEATMRTLLFDRTTTLSIDRSSVQSVQAMGTSSTVGGGAEGQTVPSSGNKRLYNPSSSPTSSGAVSFRFDKKFGNTKLKTSVEDDPNIKRRRIMDKTEDGTASGGSSEDRTADNGKPSKEQAGFSAYTFDRHARTEQLSRSKSRRYAGWLSTNRSEVNVLQKLRNLPVTDFEDIADRSTIYVAEDLEKMFSLFVDAIHERGKQMGDLLTTLVSIWRKLSGEIMNSPIMASGSELNEAPDSAPVQKKEPSTVETPYRHMIFKEIAKFRPLSKRSDIFRMSYFLYTQNEPLFTQLNANSDADIIFHFLFRKKSSGK